MRALARTGLVAVVAAAGILAAPTTAQGMYSPGGARTASAATSSTTRSTTTTTAVSPYRRLVWSDEFSRPAGALPDPRRWVMESGGLGWGEGELQAYTRGRPQNASHDGLGHLRITARKEALPGTGGARYTSARLSSEGLFSFTYGRVEARIDIPCGKGLWPAFWTMGDYDRYGWPGAGEIDVMEAINDAGHVEGHTHMPLDRYGNDWSHGAYSPSIGTTYAAGYHVYAMEWTPSYVQWFVDGRPYGKLWKTARPYGSSWVLDTRPQHLILNLAVGGAWPGPPSPATTFPRTMYVDWVRVYR